MVSVVTGDLFESNAQTLINAINCGGVMGKGIALEFKQRFPEMFADYQRLCAEGSVRLGEPYLYEPTEPPWILNFPTKGHWRAASRLSDIIAGLDYLAQQHGQWEITSLAMPALSCGYGQLEWRVVGPFLYQALSKLNIPIELYPPPGTPQSELNEVFLSRESHS
jgi:O-acetyl-ADP-ribose deacetylase (regulator of RNase III)